MSHRAWEKGVLFEMAFADSDPWAYPRLVLDEEERPNASFDGLALTVEISEGGGIVRVQFIEEGGAQYVTDTTVRSDIRSPQRTVALFEPARWGPFSAEDSDGGLQPENIRAVLVGINSEKNSEVKMVVKDLEWIRF